MSALAVLRDLLVDRGPLHPDVKALLALAWPKIAETIPESALGLVPHVRNALVSAASLGFDPRWVKLWDMGRPSGTGRGRGFLLFGGLSWRAKKRPMGHFLLELRIPSARRETIKAPGWEQEGAYLRRYI